MRLVGFSETERFIGLSELNHGILISLSETVGFVGLSKLRDDFIIGLSETIAHMSLAGHGIIVMTSSSSSIADLPGSIRACNENLIADTDVTNIATIVASFGSSIASTYSSIFAFNCFLLTVLSLSEIVPIIVELSLSEIVHFIVKFGLSEFTHFRFRSA